MYGIFLNAYKKKYKNLKVVNKIQKKISENN